MLTPTSLAAGALLLVASTLGPCAEPGSDAPPSTGLAPAGEVEVASDPGPGDFVLAVGEQERAGAGPLLVRFDRVVEDSRCPTGVTCVWAGRAVVEIAVSLEDSEAPERSFELEVGGEPAEVYGWRLAAVRLDPHPRADEPTATADYRLALDVAPAGTG